MHSITSLEKLLISSGLEFKESKIVDDYFLTGIDGAVREEYRCCQQDIAERMVELAELKKQDVIWEPSAGKGVILKLIKDFDGHVFSEIRVDFVVHNLLPISSHLIGLDCMGIKTVYGFDKIIMNPPFSFRKYVDHILRAWELLRSKGTLVFLYPKNAIALKIQNKKFIEFLEKVEKQDVGNVCGLCECVIGKIVKP